MCFDGFSQSNDCIDENTHLGRTQTGGDTVFGAATGCLVFQSQCNVRQHPDLTSTYGHQ